MASIGEKYYGYKTVVYVSRKPMHVETVAFLKKTNNNRAFTVK